MRTPAGEQGSSPNDTRLVLSLPPGLQAARVQRPNGIAIAVDYSITL
jgi:hypothetical protein